MLNIYKKKFKNVKLLILLVITIFIFACDNRVLLSDNFTKEASVIEVKESEYLQESFKLELDEKDDITDFYETEIDISTDSVIENEYGENIDGITRISFVGDVYLSRKPQAAYDEKGLKGIIDDSYKKIIDSSDFSVANLECSITDDTEDAVDKTFTFALPSKYIKAIKELGIDLFTMANNHILDFGINAMNNTIKVFDENNILHMGVGKNLDEAKKMIVKEIKGKKYGFIAASAVLPRDDWKASDDRGGVYNGYDIKNLCKEIKKVKASVDKLIVYMHWGRELETVSNTWQKQFARSIVDAGADLVIGSHPHVIQEIEYYKNVPIVYSLGNFIYGGTVRDTMLVMATFDYSIDSNGKLRLIVYPGLSNYEKVKEYWEKEKVKEKIKELQDKSSTCYIGDNGYVFTIEEVEAALKMLASSSEIN